MVATSQASEITPEMRKRVLEDIATEARQKKLNQLAKAREVRARRRVENRDRMLQQLAEARRVRSQKAAARRAAKTTRSVVPSSAEQRTGTHPMPESRFLNGIEETLTEVSRLSVRGNVTQSARLHQHYKALSAALARASAEVAALALLNEVSENPQ